MSPETKRKPIGIVTASLEKVGGTELYVRAALEGLSASGRDVKVTVSRDEVADAPQGVVDTCFLPHLASTSIRPKVALLKFRELQRAVDFLSDCQCIVFHGLSHGCISLLNRLRHLGKPIIGVIHTIGLTCPAAARYLPQSGGICRRHAGWGCLGVNSNEGCLRVNHASGVPLSLALRLGGFQRRTQKVLDACDGLIVNSKATKDLLSRWHALPAVRVVWPPVGIPSSLSHRSREQSTISSTSAAHRRILFVGRLYSYKGPSDALEVLRLLPEDYRLVVFGEGPERSHLSQQAKELGIEDRIDWRGWCSSEEIGRELAQGGVMVVPSKWFEAFGQIGPQAIARGCPVIAFDGGGVREWCTPEAGTVVPMGDTVAMASEVRRWSFARERGRGVDPHLQRFWQQREFGTVYVAALDELCGGNLL